MLVPLEHAMLARGVADSERTAAFARYSLIGALAGAAGSLAAATPDALALAGIGQVTAFKLMFLVYAVLGLASAALYRRLPHVEMQRDTLDAARALAPHGVQARRAVQPRFFAGGLAVQSMLALWLFERFELSLSGASLFFFWSSTLGAFSFPVAAWLSKRIGLVNTMVFTHIPSSLFLILAVFAPNLIVALALLLLRSALSQMDVPTRTSYVMAVVTPAERTAAASVTAVPRGLASSISPALTGALLATPPPDCRSSPAACSRSSTTSHCFIPSAT